MRRNIDLIIAILDNLNASNGYTNVVAGENNRILPEYSNAILLSEELCPDAETLFYHVNMMAQGDLVHGSRNNQAYDYAVCKIAPDGRDFIESIMQYGVIDDAEAEYGNSWRNWPLDIMVPAFIDMADAKRNIKGAV